jgi:hypothetical protein
LALLAHPDRLATASTDPVYLVPTSAQLQVQQLSKSFVVWLRTAAARCARRGNGQCSVTSWLRAHETSTAAVMPAPITESPRICIFTVSLDFQLLCVWTLPARAPISRGTNCAPAYHAMCTVYETLHVIAQAWAHARRPKDNTNFSMYAPSPYSPPRLRCICSPSNRCASNFSTVAKSTTVFVGSIHRSKSPGESPFIAIHRSRSLVSPLFCERIGNCHGASRFTSPRLEIKSKVTTDTTNTPPTTLANI